jgi:hypothetical protein
MAARAGTESYENKGIWRLQFPLADTESGIRLTQRKGAKKGAI